MPLERIVERLLMVSDNDAAEVVFRQAAIGAGKKGSIAGATKVVRARLIKLGHLGRRDEDQGRQRSGPADQGARGHHGEVVAAAAEEKHPELRGV